MNRRRHRATSRLKRLITVASITVAALTVLSGCGSPPSAPSTTEGAGTSDDHVEGELLGVDPDFARNMAGCLEDAGFEVEIEDSSTIGVRELPEDQAGPYAEASRACEAKFGYDEPPTLSNDTRAQLYRAMVKLAGCLTDEGHSVTEIPSEQAYLDGVAFDPYVQVLEGQNVSQAEYDRLHEICPYP